MIVKTPDEWLAEEEFAMIEIVDATGWQLNQQGWTLEWDKPISKQEMWRRVMKSKLQIKSTKDDEYPFIEI